MVRVGNVVDSSIEEMTANLAKAVAALRQIQAVEQGHPGKWGPLPARRADRIVHHIRAATFSLLEIHEIVQDELRESRADLRA